MGVHNLWELLAPVGRRVSVETLTGKKLAIDASIWIVQFMKAMRDEKGEMVRNAHLIGFFRRICKLLFLRTKPVFVFDGGTPALKRRTVIARRRQRENAQLKIRKTAEKLLLNQLKTMKLKQLAEEIKQQRVENDGNGKKVLVDQTDGSKDISEKNDTVLRSFNEEKLDEMLAASLAAEEDGSFADKASTSSTGIPLEEEEDDDDEEMILPTMQGKIDPAVLAALPPSMQLDLLVQMRERLMAENRQKYQKVKKAPSKFSELQIQSYLKTVAFRREIDQVRKSASGRGVGGVQPSRIASESNREFIFSSSFTGDKEALTFAGAERSRNMQPQTLSMCPPSSLDSAATTVKASRTTRSVEDESGRVLEEDVETYIDDRGHIRFSRVRAMGIRMTRDLQRNLDMIKEMEQDTSNSNSAATSTASIINDNMSFPCEDQLLETSNNDVINNINQQSIPKNGASIEISFEEDGDDGDDLFARLVAGNPVIISSVDNNLLRKQSPTSNSESDWEDGFVENKVSSLPNDVKAEIKPSAMEGNISNDSEVEWEEGVCDGSKSASSCPVECSKSISKGQREEETEMEEAIRRSLEDLQGFKCVETSSESNNRERFREMTHEYPRLKLQSVDFPQQNKSNSKTLVGDDKQEDTIKTSVQMTIDASGSQLAHAYFLPILQSNDFAQQYELSYEALIGNDKKEDLIDRGVQMITDAPGRLLASPAISNHDKMAASLVGKSFERFPVSGAVNLQEETPELFISSEKLADVSSKVFNSVFSNVPDAELVDRCQFGFEAGQETADIAVEEDCAEQTSINLVDEPKLAEEIDPNNISVEKEHRNAVTEDFTGYTPINLVDEPKLAEEIDPNNISVEKEHSNAVEKDFSEQTPFNLADEPNLVEEIDPSNISVEKEHNNAEFTEASLEEEMFVLDQEFINLGDEQRRNERNAESVSSEMFAECQELLQMFGLPYIIAPMEAEAQCADMELANLVDGVVTDDSDVFLFGARSVYKNIFDDRKYVETYFMKDIEKELGLSRDKLIRMALLLGSDYTEGISGIGIVNAIEVVNAFPEEDGLNKFREWIESPDPNIFGKFRDKISSSSRRRGSSVNETDASGCNVNDEAVSASEQSMDYIEEIRQIFMDKHRNVSKNWHIPASFPSEAVISAYTSPQVDKSTEPFAWGKPDLFVLRKLCWEKFGWSGQKADDLLLPVLKEYNKHETQLRLEAFYTFNERFAKVRSKRITKAVKGITANQSSESQETSGQAVSKTKRRRKQSNTKETVSLMQSEEEEIINKLTPSMEGKALTRKRAVGRGSVRKSSGKKRSRGSGRNQQASRGGRKGSHADIDSAMSSSSDGHGNSSDNEQEDHAENLEELHEVRRSSRFRKSVSYNVDELEYDKADKPSDKIYEKSAEVHASEKELSQDTCRDVLIETTQHNFVEDHSEIGTTFCMDEEEIGELSVGHNQDPLFESEYAKEYLKMGGGFCMEEDETEKMPFEQADDPCLDSLDKAECVNHLAESVYGPKKPSNRPHNEAEASTVKNLDFPNAATNEVCEDRSNYGDQTTSGSALKAMPLLRKKRRN